MRQRKHIRSKWEITLDILRAILEEEGVAKKTHIMQKAYLDWRNFQKHFNFLLEQGFIAEREEEPESKRKEYYLTEEGINLLRGLKEVEEALE